MTDSSFHRLHVHTVWLAERVKRLLKKTSCCRSLASRCWCSAFALDAFRSLGVIEIIPCQAARCQCPLNGSLCWAYVAQQQVIPHICCWPRRLRADLCEMCFWSWCACFIAPRWHANHAYPAFLLGLGCGCLSGMRECILKMQSQGNSTDFTHDDRLYKIS